jgi:hypothetical protein
MYRVLFFYPLTALLRCIMVFKRLIGQGEIFEWVQKWSLPSFLS